MVSEIKEITWHLNADMTVVDFFDGTRLGFSGLLSRDQVLMEMRFFEEGY